MTRQYLKKLSGLGIALGLALGATAAHATDWTVSGVAMKGNADGSVTEIGSWGVLKNANSNPADFQNGYKKTGDSYIGKILLTVNNPGGGTFTVDSFCVDLFDALTAPATFATDTVSSLAINGSLISSAKTTQLSALLSSVDNYIANGTFGASNTSASAGTQADRSAAAQLAIWEIVNETSDSVYNVDASSGSFGLFGAMKASNSDTLSANAISDANALLTAVKTASAPSGFSVGLVRSSGNQTQIVYGAGALRLFGAVPEPASWGMMLLGFGVVGGALRRRKPAFAAIA